jgi:hypothetical protein
VLPAQVRIYLDGHERGTARIEVAGVTDQRLGPLVDTFRGADG